MPGSSASLTSLLCTLFLAEEPQGYLLGGHGVVCGVCVALNGLGLQGTVS